MIHDAFLTNSAYGFPRRGNTRRIAPTVLAVVHITGNPRNVGADAALNERNYANRPGSLGPSAHYYIGRDGNGIHAIDERRFAAWSNGDLNQPVISNAGVARLVALKRNGLNANEGCYLEIECVGDDTTALQWTDAQYETVARLLAEAHSETRIPVDRTTVLPHRDINTVDRPNCPFLASHREADMARLLARARELIGAPPTEGTSDVNTTITILPYGGGRFVIPAGSTVLGFKLDGPGGAVGTKKSWPAHSEPSSASYDAMMSTDATRGNPFLRGSDGFFDGFYVSAGAVVETPNSAPTPPAPDCGPTVAKAIADYRARAIAALPES